MLSKPHFLIREVIRTIDNESDFSECYCAPSNNGLSVSEGGGGKKERMMSAKDKKLKTSPTNKKRAERHLDDDAKEMR